MFISYLLLYLVAKISFVFPRCIEHEYSRKVKHELVLSRPLSTTVKVRVNTFDGTATGK